MNIDERAASLVGDMPWITEHLTDAQIGDMKRQIAASMRALTAAEPQDELEILHSMRDGDFQPRPESVAESTLRKYVQETHNHYQLLDGSPLPDGYYTDDEQCLLRRMRPQ